jgi:predicted nucleic acid-binding protein
VSHLSVPKIYLDNCCYNRPFDSSSLEKVRDEAAAKMFIQSLVKYKSLELYTSFMLFYEINDNPEPAKKEHILNFIKKYASVHVDIEQIDEITIIRDKIMLTGVKLKDAFHLACAIFAECDYFITTDKRLLKYQDNRINLVNPIEFIKLWREII